MENKNVNKVELDINFFGKLLDNLSAMIGYADDEMLDEEDELYRDFFNDVKDANDVLEKGNEIYSEFWETQKELWKENK